jgi:branched-chain amino acid transport system substrate-binding protein
MKVKSIGAGFAAAALMLTGSAFAQDQEPIDIGVVLTLSGPPAVLGEHARDGFHLALEELGGKMAGRDVNLQIVDDELKPDVALSKTRALLERDRPDFVVGTIFSNILQAIYKPVTESETFLISPNAGPSTFAGQACSPYFFVTSYQNDQVHEVLGQYAQNQGYQRVFLIAPNYQAGKDSLAGFKNSYKGEVVDEIYTPLGQLDFSAEIARIAAAKPDALFIFMPGGMGVNFVKQYRQSGLADTVPFLSAFTVDETTLPAQQDAALGFFGAASWAPNLDNPQNQKFVEAFEAKYGYVPGSYAAQAYDAAKLINSALEATGGDLSDKDAVRKALEAADFQSVRGDFSFNENHYPIQDFYLLKVAKRDDGKYQTEIVEKIFDDYGDNYASACNMS